MIEIGDRVVLNPKQVAMIKDNARQRYESNRAAGVNDAARGSRRGLYYDMLGSAGELVFAHLCQGEFDELIYPRSSSRGEDKGDIVHRGRVVQVKTTEYPTGRLVAPPWAKNDSVSEVYALIVLVPGVTESGPAFEFRGFASAKEFIVDTNISDLGHGPSYVLPQSRLVPESGIQWADVDSE